MKRILITIISFIIILFAFIFSLFINKRDVIKVSEVTHSLFYTPFYVAIENGYFADEGLDIELILISGADKVASAVLSDDVQIGLAGPESAIYVYENGEQDYLVTFAGLTKKDGQFIVSRNSIDEFKIEDLYNSEVLVGRSGGMPSLNFINGVKNMDGDINKINVNTSIDFASLTGAFISGIGDYVNLFEPNALKLEQMGFGHVVASVGNYSGELPYTAFYARKSYVDNNQEVINRFNNAINRGIMYVMKHDVDDIANVVKNQFNDISFNDIKTIIERYKNNDTWYNNTTILEDDYKNLENIMIDNGLLEDYVPFKDLVININE